MLRAFIIGAVLAACATTGETSAEVRRVISTTSFGECWGYCDTRLEISSSGAVLVLEPVNDPAFAPQRFSRSLTPAEWQEIQRLAAAVDLTAVPDVVGCPDCDDSGAEGLTIEGPNGSESVSLEFRAPLPAAQPLLDRVRALRDELTPQSR